MFTLRKRELCSQNCMTAFLLLLALPSLTRSLNWILVNRFVRLFWASLGCTVRASLAEEFWDDLQRLGARDAIEVSSVWITQEMSHLSSYILSSLTSRRLLRVSWRLLHIIPFFFFAFVPSCQILDQLPRRVFCFCIPGCLLSKCFATLYILTKFINIYCQINWVDTSHGSQTCYFLIWGFWVRCQSWYNLETC